MRAEYDFSKGVRGKYHKRIAKEGSNIVVLEPDVAKAFPDSASVNEALRLLLKAGQSVMASTSRIPTVDELWAFARSVEGEPLQTSYRPKPFTVSVDGAKLRITPGSGKPRATTRTRVAEILKKLERTGTFQPVQYQHLTYNASYVLTLVKLWQGA